MDLGYLQMEDCNFISIDWSRMAVGNYSYVATNYIPLAGNLTGQFINFLVGNGADLDLIHLIGHRYVTLPYVSYIDLLSCSPALVLTSAVSPGQLLRLDE